MKKLFLLIFFTLGGTAFAGDAVIYSTSVGNVTVYRSNIHTPDYAGKTGVLVATDRTPQTVTDFRNLLAQAGNPIYLMVDSGALRVMTVQEKDSLDQFIENRRRAEIRDGAKMLLDGFISDQVFNRAFADIIKDEINILRGLFRQYTPEDNASLPDRDLSQLKNAILNRIDSGQVD